MHFEKVQLDQIENDRLLAIICIMPDIWQTVRDSWTITIKQNVQFQRDCTKYNYEGCLYHFCKQNHGLLILFMVLVCLPLTDYDYGSQHVVLKNNHKTIYDLKFSDAFFSFYIMFT